MLVSTKGRYALRVMVDLAEHQAAGRIPLKEIAARQGISEKYLENILATLVRANMLSGMRGKGGGYVLTRPPEQYTVGEKIYHFHPVPKCRCGLDDVVIAMVGSDKLIERHTVEVVVDELVQVLPHVERGALIRT